ncbi:MAG: hypothetical protein IPP77_15835 [Bacteroidetes bacterium]|nr:hypothetical protein [Bacteroidota bacterium]
MYDDGTHVGIGTTSPSAYLDIYETTIGSLTDLINLANDGDGFNIVSYKTGVGIANSFAKDNDTSGSSTMYISGNLELGTPTLEVYAGNNELAAYLGGQLKIVDGTEGENKVLTSDADGLASWKDLEAITGSTVAFSAGDQIGTGVLDLTTTPMIFDSVFYNLGGGYDPNTGEFTAPVTGLYHFDASILWGFPPVFPVAGGYYELDYLVNGVVTNVEIQTFAAGEWSNLSRSTDLYLNVGDIVSVQILHNSGTVEVTTPDAANSTFTGHLIR